MKFNNQHWFLDHIGLNHKIIYNGHWEKKDYLLYQEHMKRKLEEFNFNYVLNKKYLREYTSEPIRLWWKGDSVNIIFEGSFFKGTDIKTNVNETKKIYERLIYNLFKDYRKPYSKITTIREPTIYRLDVGCNMEEKVDLNRIEIKGRSTKLRKYFEDKDDNKKVTGIQYGNRGRDYTHLRIYNKEYDNNKFHDYIRFKRCNFIRMEYELGSRPLKNYNMRYLKDLHYNKLEKRIKKNIFNKPIETYEKGIMNRWESLIKRCHNSARPIFDYDNTKPIKNYKCLPNNKLRSLNKYYYKETVRGIIMKHFKDEKDYKWLKENINLYES